MEGETKESFQSRMTETLLSAYRLVGVSVGAKLGLFDVFGPDNQSFTSTELASRAKCKERYIREWLHHMVMCDIIDVDDTGTKFTLPAHRREVLTEEKQLIPAMGTSFPYLLLPHRELLECFHEDGPPGLPFEAVLPFFNERATQNIPFLNECADFLRDNVPGLRDQLDNGIRVCDVGCGKGTVLLRLAAQFPKSQFVGIDLSTDLLAVADASLAEQGLTNVEFVLQDATSLPEEWKETFDYMFSRDVLHDIAHISKALDRCYRCLKPRGFMSVIEVNMDTNPHLARQDSKQKFCGEILYCVSMFHCLPASMNTPGSAALGAGAGVGIFVRLMEDAGFELQEEPKPADLLNKHILCRKP